MSERFAACNAQWQDSEVTANAAGVPDEVLRALTARNFGTQAGWPRPRANGMPVPWTTPCLNDAVDWAGVLSERVTACHDDWLCQVCGDALGETGWVVLEYGDMVVGGGAMHKRCLKLALQWCPHLTGNAGDFETSEIRHHQLGTRRSTVQ
jgi:hypothetical protein